MLNSVLANFYEQDLRKMIEEINAFKNEENLWKTQGSVKNPAGNLGLHIAGGLNYLVGTLLANTGYVRDRDAEFSKRNVPRKEIVSQLEAVIPIVTGRLKDLDLNEEFPIPYDNDKRSNTYVLVRLYAHLDYHLGQVNYLRRILEP